MHLKQVLNRPLLLALTVTLLTGAAGAGEPEEWEGWDALPDQFLELTDQHNAAELSARLDRLIRESGSTEQAELILEAWLRQLNQQEGGASLDSLLEDWEAAVPPQETASGGTSDLPSVISSEETRDKDSAHPSGSAPGRDNDGTHPSAGAPGRGSTGSGAADSQGQNQDRGPGQSQSSGPSRSTAPEQSSGGGQGRNNGRSGGGPSR